MERREVDGLAYYYFESVGVPHGIFTRLGGLSEGHLKSLNVGATVGDDPLNVSTNRRRMLGALDLEPDTMRTVWQVHGRTVLVANGKEPPPDVRPPQADGRGLDKD